MIFKLPFLIFLTFILLNGCSDSSSDAPTSDTNSNYTPTSLKTITSATEAKIALSAFNGAGSAYNLTSSSNNRTLAANYKKTETQNCLNGGNVVFEGTQFNYTQTYSDCDIGYSLYNGEVINTLADNNISGLNIFEMNTFSIISDNTTSYMNLTTQIQFDTEHSRSTLNGSMNIQSQFYNLDFEYTYSNYNYDVSYLTQTSTINGSFSINDKKNSCVNGIYNIETLTPLTGSTGSVKINNTTYKFISENEVEITLEDGSISNASKNEINTALLCN